MPKVISEDTLISGLALHGPITAKLLATKIGVEDWTVVTEVLNRFADEGKVIYDSKTAKYDFIRADENDCDYVSVTF